MKKSRIYSPYATEANHLLGGLIQLQRKKKQWTMQDLAERAGISRITLQKIEQGEMTCAIGLVFEVALLVGINLFDLDNKQLKMQLNNTQEQLTLLPASIHKPTQVIYDDF